MRFWRKARQEYDGLKERREPLRERLDALRRAGMGKEERRWKIKSLEQQLRILESRIKRFQTSLDTRIVATRPDGFFVVETELLY